MSQTRRNLLVSFITQYAELVIQFAGVMVLARLLSPAETGTYSVAAFLMALLHVFRDFGIATYLVQEPSLTIDKIRSAFGVAILFAWTVASALFVASGAVADLYHAPEMRRILWIMSASFALTPVGSVLGALFRREMQFKKMLIVRICSATAQVAVSVALALDGMGALSLAWGNFAGILAFGVAAMSLRSAATPWLPRFRNFKEVLSFGSISSIGSFANVAGTHSPDVIIGKAIGLAAAGYFSRANGLIQLFKTLVAGSAMPLVVPYFAQVRREKADPAKPYYEAVAHLTAIAFPFFAVMGLLAMPLLRTLYGSQWDASVPVAQVLCAAGAIASVTMFAREVMVASGFLVMATRAGVAANTFRVIAVVAGSCTTALEAIAYAVVIAECIGLVIMSRALRASLGIRLRETLGHTGKSLIVAAWSSAVPAAIVLLDAHRGSVPLFPLLGGVAGAGCGLIAGIVWTGHPIAAHLRSALDRAKRLLRARATRGDC